MSKKEGDEGHWRPFRILVRVALIASAIALVVAVCAGLSERARLVLGGMICALGVIVLIVMLIILIRQSDVRE